MQDVLTSCKGPFWKEAQINFMQFPVNYDEHSAQYFFKIDLC
jgi:hypothetical protein